MFVFGIRLINKLNLEITPKDFADYIAFGWFFLIIGARLGYVVFYNPGHYLAYPEQIPKIWLGGMSFHGALLGLTAGLYVISKFKNQSFWPAADIIALLAPLTLGLGRLANFVNGELAGRVTDVPWAVIFPRYADSLARHPSQLYQALTEGLLLFIILYRLRTKLKFEGLISCYFLMGYGCMRFLCEFFREPDKQVGYILGAFSLGQLFCAVMILAGFMMLKAKTKDNPLNL